jgi:hypothetical protein
MSTLRIERGQKAQVKVTKIDLCVKTVSFRTGAKCKHDIHIQNQAGETAICETFTLEGVRPDFVEGVMQWVQCVAISPAPHFTMDIKPTEPPNIKFGIDRQEPIMAATYPTPRQEQPTENNMYTLNASGKMITFATAYAKDILVAEISKKPEGYEVTDDDIQRMMGWAAKICAETVDLVNF